jgi:hypothetical protein
MFHSTLEIAPFSDVETPPYTWHNLASQMLKNPLRATWLDASIPTASQGQPGNLKLDRSMPVARATLSRSAAGILRNRCPLRLVFGTRAGQRFFSLLG